jgi:hypothetical protein
MKEDNYPKEGLGWLDVRIDKKSKIVVMANGAILLNLIEKEQANGRN